MQPPADPHHRATAPTSVAACLDHLRAHRDRRRADTAHYILEFVQTRGLTFPQQHYFDRLYVHPAIAQRELQPAEHISTEIVVAYTELLKAWLDAPGARASPRVVLCDPMLIETLESASLDQLPTLAGAVLAEQFLPPGSVVCVPVVQGGEEVTAWLTASSPQEGPNATPPPKGDHWVLFVVDLSGGGDDGDAVPRVYGADSLCLEGCPVMPAALRRWLQMSLPDWDGTMRCARSRQQLCQVKRKKANDCAVHVMQNLEMIVRYCLTAPALRPQNPPWADLVGALAGVGVSSKQRDVNPLRALLEEKLRTFVEAYPNEDRLEAEARRMRPFLLPPSGDAPWGEQPELVVRPEGIDTVADQRTPSWSC